MLFCQVCRKPHNTLLHIKGKSCITLFIQNDNSVDFLDVKNNSKFKIQEPLLTTAVVQLIKYTKNECINARALLDNASQYNFITKKLAQILGCKISKSDSVVKGIEHSSKFISKATTIRLQSTYFKVMFDLPRLIVDNIVESTIPEQFFEIESWKISKNIRLTDPAFNTPMEVDLLLGLNLFWNVLGYKTLILNKNLPQLRETKLGWIVADSTTTNQSLHEINVFFAKKVTKDLLETVEKFWLIEQVDNLSAPLSEKELKCETLYTETTTRIDNKKFMVYLPFEICPSHLGNSKNQALKRFYYLEKKLKNNKILNNLYCTCMEEYITLEHMKEIKDENNSESKPHNYSYYIPHHAIFKETSTTTKLRVVFDASMPTSSGLSLNDILLVGFVVQPELLSTLLRFRTHKYVFVANITKSIVKF